MLKKKRFADVLRNNAITLYKSIGKDNNIQGYCSTLKQLLQDNWFMYDFLKGFDIQPITLNLKDKEYLKGQDLLYMENLLKVTMDSTAIVEYSKDIDLTKIQRDYVIVSDITENIYIVAYDRGEYVVRRRVSLL